MDDRPGLNWPGSDLIQLLFIAGVIGRRHCHEGLPVRLNGKSRTNGDAAPAINAGVLYTRGPGININAPDRAVLFAQAALDTGVQVYRKLRKHLADLLPCHCFALLDPFPGRDRAGFRN